MLPSRIDIVRLAPVPHARSSAPTSHLHSHQSESSEIPRTCSIQFLLCDDSLASFRRPVHCDHPRVNTSVGRTSLRRTLIFSSTLHPPCFATSPEFFHHPRVTSIVEFTSALSPSLPVTEDRHISVGKRQPRAMHVSVRSPPIQTRPHVLSSYLLPPLSAFVHCLLVTSFPRHSTSPLTGSILCSQSRFVQFNLSPIYLAESSESYNFFDALNGNLTFCFYLFPLQLLRALELTFNHFLFTLCHDPYKFINGCKFVGKTRRQKNTRSQRGRGNARNPQV